jgi:hypothetical protein
MNRPARSLSSLLTLSLALAPLLSACGGLLSYAEEDSESAALAAQCAELQDDCEGFVQAYCGRVTECGFASFSECEAFVEENGWRCDQASTLNAGDLAQCNADTERLSCSAIGGSDPFAGTACESVDLRFSDEGCSAFAADNDGSDSSDNGSEGNGGGGGGDTCACSDYATQGFCQGHGCTWMRDSYDYNDPNYYSGYCAGVPSGC